MTSAAAPPAPHPAVETALLDNQVVLFDERTGHVQELSASASAVWLLMDGQLSIAQIADELHDVFAVEHHTIADDVAMAIAHFAGRGLLAGTEPPVEEFGEPNPATTSADPLSSQHLGEHEVLVTGTAFRRDGQAVVVVDPHPVEGHVPALAAAGIERLPGGHAHLAMTPAAQVLSSAGRDTLRALLVSAELAEPTVDEIRRWIWQHATGDLMGFADFLDRSAHLVAWVESSQLADAIASRLPPARAAGSAARS